MALKGVLTYCTACRHVRCHSGLDSTESDWTASGSDLRRVLVMSAGMWDGAKWVMSSVADEEDGSRLGVQVLVRDHPDLISCDVMVTEAGGFPFYIGDRLMYPVQISEKGSVEIGITSHGTGGHSCFSHNDNAIGRIGHAASMLSTHRLPLHVNPQAQMVND